MSREKEYGSEEEYFIDHPLSETEAETYAAGMLGHGVRISVIRRELEIRQVATELAEQIISRKVDGLVSDWLTRCHDDAQIERALSKRGIGPETADEILARCRKSPAPSTTAGAGA